MVKKVNCFIVKVAILLPIITNLDISIFHQYFIGMQYAYIHFWHNSHDSLQLQFESEFDVLHSIHAKRYFKYKL